MCVCVRMWVIEVAGDPKANRLASQPLWWEEDLLIFSTSRIYAATYVAGLRVFIFWSSFVS